MVTPSEGDEATAPAVDTTSATADGEQVMELLSERVPLSLIMDLVGPAGPHSMELLAEEGEPETAWWEQPRGPQA